MRFRTMKKKINVIMKKRSGPMHAIQCDVIRRMIHVAAVIVSVKINVQIMIRAAHNCSRKNVIIDIVLLAIAAPITEKARTLI